MPDPPPPPQTLMRKFEVLHPMTCVISQLPIGFGPSNFLWGLGVTPTHVCMCVHACVMDVCGCKQEGNKGISGILVPIFGTISVPVALVWSICVILHVFYHVC